MSTRSKLRPILLSPAKASAAPVRVYQQASPASPAFDHEVVKRRIRKSVLDVLRVCGLSNGTGTQYVILGGGNVNVYNTGTVTIQGKVSEADRTRLQRALRRMGERARTAWRTRGASSTS